MSKIKLILSSILLTALVSCKYNPKDMTPIAIDFSKQTVNIFKVKTNDPLEFYEVERGVPFAEIERRILAKEMEPVFALEVSEVQKMRRAYDKINK